MVLFYHLLDEDSRLDVFDHAKSLFDVLIQREIKSPIHSIPYTTTIGEAYEAFKKRKEHIFIVIDEHGGFDGVLSLEDVIETLLGIEITDEFDDVADMRAYAADVWKQKKEDALEE